MRSEKLEDRKRGILCKVLASQNNTSPIKQQQVHYPPRLSEQLGSFSSVPICDTLAWLRQTFLGLHCPCHLLHLRGPQHPYTRPWAIYKLCDPFFGIQFRNQKTR